MLVGHIERLGTILLTDRVDEGAEVRNLEDQSELTG